MYLLCRNAPSARQNLMRPSLRPCSDPSLQSVLKWALEVRPNLAKRRPLAATSPQTLRGGRGEALQSRCGSLLAREGGPLTQEFLGERPNLYNAKMLTSIPHTTPTPNSRGIARAPQRLLGRHRSLPHELAAAHGAGHAASGAELGVVRPPPDMVADELHLHL